MIAVRVSQKGRLRRIWRIMKEMIADGNVKDMLEIKVRGRIREGIANRYRYV
jgi:hypothetical protein